MRRSQPAKAANAEAVKQETVETRGGIEEEVAELKAKLEASPGEKGAREGS